MALRILVGVLLGLAVVAAFLVLRPPGPSQPVDAPDPDANADSATAVSPGQWQSFLSEHFAGDEACSQCHIEQFEAHQRSGHSQTATPMELSDLADRLEGDRLRDSRRDQTFSFTRNEDLFQVSTHAGDPAFPVHWLLGSGVHAQTPVSIDPVSGYGVEFRWSWITGRDSVGLTPDHERFDEYRPHSLECFGRPLDPQQALACVNCHMTAVPPPGVSPSRDMFLANVGCERCHGPRKRHVELARQGRAAEVPPLLKYEDRDSYMNHCAECHRDQSNVPADSAPESLARYQPYGLKKSECYLQSDSLTCSTCHDPHDRVHSDRSVHRRNCLQCHQSADQSQCLHSPAGDCVQCHMPSVEWSSGITFHDHWIRIPDEAPPAAADENSQ